MSEIFSFIIGLGILIFLSAFFSGSETSLFSLSSIQVRKLGTQSHGMGKTVARLLSNPRKLLISLLIGNMIVNIFSSSLSASFFRRLFSDTSLHNVSEALSVIVMTTIIIIFGEITPKTLAINNSEKIALRVAPFIQFLYKIVSPIRFILFKITNGIVLLAGKIIGSNQTVFSTDEIRMAATLGHSEGELAKEEKELIHGVIRLEKRIVKEIMTARMEINAIEIKAPLDEIKKIVQTKKYTRIPVYEEKIDNIRGILYSKDLFLLNHSVSGKISDILKPPYFVPETLKVDILLQEFKKRRTHIAIVVDEYGTVSGLVTLEDILELLVGNIYDKADESKFYSLINKDKIQVKSLFALEDFNEIFGTRIRDEYAATVGGFVTHRLGKIPQKGEVFIIDNLEFTIIEAAKNRIEEMVIRRLGEKA